jgi:hypothetical protein
MKKNGVVNQFLLRLANSKALERGLRTNVAMTVRNRNIQNGSRGSRKRSLVN